MAAPSTEEWTTLESLILVSYVGQTNGSLNWPNISKQLRTHPLFDHKRDPSLFNHRRCQQQFEALMEKFYATEKRKSLALPELASRLEDLLKKERLAEVTEALQATADEIKQTRSEIRSIKAGQKDAEVSRWYHEQQRLEIQDLKLTNLALADSPPPDTFTAHKDDDVDTIAKIEKFLKKIFAHRLSEPFRKPVTLEEADDYYTIIKNPTDLSSIRLKFFQGHIKTRQDLWREMSLIFDNAFRFNEKNSPMYKTAENFREHVIKEMEMVFNSDDTKVEGISTRYGRKK